MDRSELKKLFGEYWSFAREFVRKRGNFELTIAETEISPSGLENEISRGLHSFGIDPKPFWDFHTLIWHDLIPNSEGGELEGERLRELRQAMHGAWLTLVLLDDDAPILLAPIEEDIFSAIDAVGCRLVTNEVLKKLASDQCVHGESTVKQRLAIMVNRKALTNKTDTKGKGYGLPDWG